MNKFCDFSSEKSKLTRIGYELDIAELEFIGNEIVLLLFIWDCIYSRLIA